MLGNNKAVAQLAGFCIKSSADAWEPYSNNRGIRQTSRLNDITSLNPFNSTNQPVNFLIGIVERQ